MVTSRDRNALHSGDCGELCLPSRSRHPHSQTLLSASSLVLARSSSDRITAFCKRHVDCANSVTQNTFPDFSQPVRNIPNALQPWQVPCEAQRSPVWSFSHVHPVSLQKPGYLVLCQGCLMLFLVPSLSLTWQKLPCFSPFQMQII